MAEKKPKKVGRATSVGRSPKGRPAYTLSKKTVRKMGAEGPKRSMKTFSGKKPPRRTPGLGKAMKNTQRGRKPWN